MKKDKALSGTALQQPREIVPRTVKPLIVRRVLTDEQQAIYLANKQAIDDELDRLHRARVETAQTAAFERMNAAELKRERKRERNRQLMEKQS